MIIPTKDTSFSQFMGSMVVDFPLDNIPSEINESNWREVGESLVQESSFSRSGAPSPSGFSSRTAWEQAVFQSMASFS